MSLQVRAWINFLDKRINLYSRTFKLISDEALIIQNSSVITKCIYFRWARDSLRQSHAFITIMIMNKTLKIPTVKNYGIENPSA